MAIERTDTVVIGAGVIGLAVGRALARNGHEVIVLEANPVIGQETSSRNSGVIHAGIYYPPGSLKARCCIRGKEMLYRYCAERAIPHAGCGKIVVANSPEQQRRLRALQENAHAAGVRDLEWLDAAQARALEPEVVASAALLSPSSGIVDVHELMLALVADIEAANGAIVTQSRVLGGRASGDGLRLSVDSGGPATISAAMVVNAAGHGAAALASAIDGVPPGHVPRVHLARGHYFEHSGPLPFARLVYPMPDAASLGIHATVDLGGQGRFGPDVEYCATVNYSFDDTRRQNFITAIREWYPGLDASRLRPGFVGVRPKLQGPGEGFADFLVSGPAAHGVPGLVNLFGIDSPGLTSCLALADEVVSALRPE